MPVLLLPLVLLPPAAAPSNGMSGSQFMLRSSTQLSSCRHSPHHHTCLAAAAEFDFHGYKGAHFAILSEPSHQLNAYFGNITAHPELTWMHAIGLTHGRDQAEVGLVHRMLMLCSLCSWCLSTMPLHVQTSMAARAA